MARASAIGSSVVLAALALSQMLAITPARARTIQISMAIATPAPSLKRPHVALQARRRRLVLHRAARVARLAYHASCTASQPRRRNWSRHPMRRLAFVAIDLPTSDPPRPALVMLQLPMTPVALVLPSSSEPRVCESPMRRRGFGDDMHVGLGCNDRRLEQPTALDGFARMQYHMPVRW
jgi:hypothetical protein